MTVKRSQSEMFDAPLPEVLKTLRAVLAKGRPGYRYDDTVESDEGRDIKTTLRRSTSGFLSTSLRIRLYTFEAKTKVAVETQSQWFLFGDIADFYGSSIRELLGAIRDGIGKDIETLTAPEPSPPQVPMKLFLAANFAGVFGILFVSLLTRVLVWFFDLSDSPDFMQKEIFYTNVQFFLGIFLLLALVGFNYWWRKNYFHLLDPKEQASMDLFRKLGRPLGIIVALLGVMYFLQVVVFKQ